MNYVLRYKYDALFDSLNPIDGKVTGASAKGEPALPMSYLKTKEFDQNKYLQER